MNKKSQMLSSMLISFFVTSASADTMAPPETQNEGSLDNSVICTDVLSRSLGFNPDRSSQSILGTALDKAIADGRQKYGSNDAFMGYLLDSLVQTAAEEDEAKRTMATYTRYGTRFDYKVRQCLFEYSR